LVPSRSQAASITIAVAANASETVWIRRVIPARAVDPSLSARPCRDESKDD
jgi:hypothetical protein